MAASSESQPHTQPPLGRPHPPTDASAHASAHASPHAPPPASATDQPPMLASDSPPEDVCRRIQVSREKKPLNFFVTLSKKFLQTDQVVELSGLGLAVTTVVTIAEILKSNGLVQLEEIRTSLVEGHSGGRSAAPKAKIQIWIRRTDNFDQLIASQLGTRSPRPEPLATAPVQEAGDTNPPVHPPVHPAP